MNRISDKLFQVKRAGRRFMAATFLVTSVWLAPPARADVIVTVEDVDIPAGGTGTIDLSIAGTGDLVQSFGFELLITPDGGTTSALKFLGEDAYLTDSDYLLFGNSFAEFFPPVELFSTDDTFIGGDFTFDSTDVSVTTEKLMARLIVEHDPSPANPGDTVGDSFTISLIPGSGDSTDFWGGSSDTGFLDSTAFFDIIPAGTVAFSSTPGTVTITAAELAIPEPSTLYLATVFLLLATARRPRHGRSFS